MSSLNKVQIIGNVGKDPEIRAMQSGDKVANISVATSEKWTDKASGEKKERTEWHRVVVFGPLADIVDRYTKKGSKIYVQGSLQTRKWTDKDGAEKYSTEVVLQGFSAELTLLDGRKPGEAQDDDAPVADRGRSTRRDDMDDDIPF